mgnify:CR=1 FL=1
MTLLIIDDNAGNLELLRSALRRPDVEILTAEDPEEGLDLVASRHPQIVLTDLVMPRVTGMEVLERIMAFDPSIDVILMTAHYSTDTAVEAIKKGASDYWNKPVPVETIRRRVDQLLETARRRIRASSLQHELLDSAEFHGIVGNSPQMWDLYSRIERVAPHYRTVLVTGQTGTGKDLVAKSLHQLSPVADGHLVVLNCSAVVETLFESELFGHVRGAFTGAVTDKTGLFEHAHRGTLFLDEIGDMPLSTQAKLLRAIQNQEIQRLGSLTPKRVDVRIIAATNRDLRQCIAEKTFREDLYYRLGMVEIAVPALSGREGDLPLLVRHFTRRFSELYRKPIAGWTRRAEIVMLRHRWPGNVRELRNVMERVVLLEADDEIRAEHLPLELTAAAGVGGAGLGDAFPSGQVRTMAEIEKMAIEHALKVWKGNKTKAADALGIARQTLRTKLKEYAIGDDGEEGDGA